MTLVRPLNLKNTSKLRYFLSRIPPPDGREALCLPNLLAGGLPAGALPGLALACAADKRAQHTRATQKSTTHARHTKEHNTHAWIYTGDITAATEMGGRQRGFGCFQNATGSNSAHRAFPELRIELEATIFHAGGHEIG